MTNPNIGKAQVPQQWQVEVLNNVDDLANRGLDPYMGSVTPQNADPRLGTRSVSGPIPPQTADERLGRLYNERASWVVDGHDAVQANTPNASGLRPAQMRDTNRVDLRTLQQVLNNEPPIWGDPIVPQGFIQPGQELQSPYAPAPPPDRTSKPENRTLEHEKDYGKPRLPLDEFIFGAPGRLLRRIATRGSVVEPMNPGMSRQERRQWAEARDAGHAAVDAGLAGIVPQGPRVGAEIDSAAKGSYVHLDPTGPPVTKPPKDPPEIKYDKLKFRN